MVVVVSSVGVIVEVEEEFVMALPGSLLLMSTG